MTIPRLTPHVLQYSPHYVNFVRLKCIKLTSFLCQFGAFFFVPLELVGRAHSRYFTIDFPHVTLSTRIRRGWVVTCLVGKICQFEHFFMLISDIFCSEWWVHENTTSHTSTTTCQFCLVYKVKQL